MDIIDIKSGKETPSIYCNAEKGLIEFKGKSVLEDPYEQLYKAILIWIKEYALVCPEKTVFNIQLEYFNTSSSKCLLDSFKVLEEIHIADNSKTVEINWYYEEMDDDMLEAGEDYEEMVKIPFKMIEMGN